MMKTEKMRKAAKDPGAAVHLNSIRPGAGLRGVPVLAERDADAGTEGEAGRG